MQSDVLQDLPAMRAPILAQTRSLREISVPAYKQQLCHIRSRLRIEPRCVILLAVDQNHCAVEELLCLAIEAFGKQLGGVLFFLNARTLFE